MGGSALNDHSRQPVQFRIGHLLVATTVLACVFACAQLLGVSGTLVTLGLVYFFAPMIAFAVSRYGTTPRVRSRIAASLLLFMACVTCCMAAIFIYPDYALWTLTGTAFIWTPQIAMLFLVHAVWKSGLRSAGVEP